MAKPCRWRADEQRQRIGVISGLDGELTLGSAGDVEELDVVDELLGNSDGGKALGAVARAGKGNHERGVLSAQEVARCAHDVGRGDGLKVVEISVASVTQIRGAGIANVVGRTGTGEDNGQTAFAHSASLGQEGLDGLLVLAIDVERITPKLGLLSNLAVVIWAPSSVSSSTLFSNISNTSFFTKLSDIQRLNLKS